jgi:hypothetical protein
MAANLRGPGAAGGGGCGRPDLALWLPLCEELDASRRRELAEHAAACAECDEKLDLLRRANQWLQHQVGVAPAAVCPPAEDLYDYGRGPGARRMPEPERLTIRAHLASCEECAGFVESLAARPPAPLLDVLPPRRTQAPARRNLRLVPVLAAAAAAVLAVMLWDTLRRDEGPTGPTVASAPKINFPSDPLLRGQTPGELLFPREKLLRSEQGLWSPLLFEIEPRERATSYRVILRRHGGGAFDEGTEVLTVESAEPDVAPKVEAADLAPGFYTWEAWATVDGLDVALGSRDFEVVADAALLDGLRTRNTAAEPARSESILHLLHDAGFSSDARAFARTLPPSPERDEYLARRPAR